MAMRLDKKGPLTRTISHRKQQLRTHAREKPSFLSDFTDRVFFFLFRGLLAHSLMDACMKLAGEKASSTRQSSLCFFLDIIFIDQRIGSGRGG
jgi:hypothetical protein